MEIQNRQDRKWHFTRFQVFNKHGNLEAVYIWLPAWYKQETYLVLIKKSIDYKK
jgi:hypothetical protein